MAYNELSLLVSSMSLTDCFKVYEKSGKKRFSSVTSESRQKLEDLPNVDIATHVHESFDTLQEILTVCLPHVYFTQTSAHIFF